MSENIVFKNVSKFYGEVLGVNQVNLDIPPGITSLVGPNGSGKTTLMNLMTGLLRPTRGRISIRATSPQRPHDLFSFVGYCTQFDSFPKGLTGYQFIYSFLRLHGIDHSGAEHRTWQALELVNMIDAAKRKVASYSKGMRQRIKLAQAICNEPKVMILDEPLNGLDPMARAEIIALFQDLAQRQTHVIISSHILHEVDMISDRVVMLTNGYVVAEGDIQDVRSELKDHPMQVLIRCDKPSLLASRVFEQDHVVEAKVEDDRQGLLVRTLDADRFFLALNEVIIKNGLKVESVSPSDEDVHSVYEYLIGKD